MSQTVPPLLQGRIVAVNNLVGWTLWNRFTVQKDMVDLWSGQSWLRSAVLNLLLGLDPGPGGGCPSVPDPEL